MNLDLLSCIVLIENVLMKRSMLICLLSSTEDELKEKLRLEQLRHSDVTYNSKIHINNVSKGEEPRAECPPAPLRPFLPSPPMPVTVIPIPVVTPNPAGSPTLPVPMLSPPAAPPLTSPGRDAHSPWEENVAALPHSPKPDPPTSVPTANHMQPMHTHHQHPQPPPQTSSTNPQQQQQQLQPHPGSIVSPPQQFPLLPWSPQHASPPNDRSSRGGSPPDDGRQLDLKKRPGG